MGLEPPHGLRCDFGVAPGLPHVRRADVEILRRHERAQPRAALREQTARGVPFAVKEDGEAVRTIVIEWESMEAAENGYNSPDYQNALKALDNGAKRAFMYLDAD